MENADASYVIDRRKRRHRLDSWKEIASYLDRAVRTVQRWERDLGLPIRRLEGGKRDIVYAFAEEIDAWLAENSHRLEANGIHDEESAKETETTAVSQGKGESSIAQAAPAPSQDDANCVFTSDQRNTSDVTKDNIVANRRVRAASVWGGLAFWPLKKKIAVGAASLLTLIFIFLYVPPRLMHQQPDSFRVENGILRVFDSDGRFLWQKRFDEKLEDHIYVDPTVHKNLAAIADLDGDGRSELLISTYVAAMTGQEFYCFEANGKIRFKHRVDSEVKFGDTTYGPPHAINRFILTENADGTKTIWATTHHNLMFPSALLKLDAKGNLLGAYWSNGHIQQVLEANLNGRRVMLVGSMDNENVGASLAVLDYENPSGFAPAKKSEYLCSNCPHGAPLYFLKFPRMELSILSGDRPTVPSLRHWPDGKFVMDVRQGIFRMYKEYKWNLAAIYTLDSEFRVQSAETDNAYRLVHQDLYLNGKIKHPYGPRDEAELFPVLEWRNGEFIAILGPQSKPAAAPPKKQVTELARIPRFRR
jgi:phage terminase Nu1 subunit (DNA packaging protein)